VILFCKYTFFFSYRQKKRNSQKQTKHRKTGMSQPQELVSSTYQDIINKRPFHNKKAMRHTRFFTKQRFLLHNQLTFFKKNASSRRQRNTLSQ